MQFCSTVTDQPAEQSRSTNGANPSSVFIHGQDFGDLLGSDPPRRFSPDRGRLRGGRLHQRCGNPIAAAAGVAAIRMIEEQGLLDHVDRAAEAFRTRLLALKESCDVVRDVRVLGMMIGVELSIDGAAVVQSCLEKNLLVNCTQGRVIRLLPAMNISPDDVHEGCDKLSDAILEVASRT